MSNKFPSRIASAARTAGVAAAAGTALGSAGTASAAPITQGDPTAGMYGNPENAARYWAHQKYDDCALMSVADVVGQVTGKLPSEAQIITLAEKTPSQNHPGSIYIRPSDTSDPNSGQGTDPEDIIVLLAKYGIRAVDSNATGIEALENELAAKHAVIVGLNAETIWNSSGGQRTRADHALVVTGIDVTKGIVHLNDSGTKDGRDEQVPIATFLKAWKTGDNEMIVTKETTLA